jgi:phosphoribosyl-dephospho-CoA transferase
MTIIPVAICNMPVVKKTVALHRIMDGYVRKLQAILIDKGWNATYSTALNYFVLYHVFDTVYGKKRREELLQAFLEDTRTLGEIAKEDIITEYSEKMLRRIREKYIG